MARLENLNWCSSSDKVRLAELLTGHLKKEQFEALCCDGFRVLLVEFPNPEICIGLLSITKGPVRGLVHWPCSVEGLGIRSPTFHPFGSFNSWFWILWNSSGVTSKMIDG